MNSKIVRMVNNNPDHPKFGKTEYFTPFVAKSVITTRQGWIEQPMEEKVITELNIDLTGINKAKETLTKEIHKAVENSDFKVLSNSEFEQIVKTPIPEKPKRTPKPKAEKTAKAKRPRIKKKK